MTALVPFFRIGRSDLRFSGPGYIAGYSPGLVTVNGSATSRSVEVRHRATRLVVNVAFSASDGSYFAGGLDPAQEFDLIARDHSGTYNDVIVARVRPVPYEVQSVTGAFTANSAAHTLDGKLDVSGGMPAFTVAVTSGTAPPGLTFSVIVGTPPTYAAVGRYVVASGTTSAGTYTWTLTVTAANGSSKSIACSATFT